MTLTESQLLLLDILLSNMISAALSQVSQMTEEEVKAEIIKEKEKKQNLMDRIRNH